MWGGGGLRGGSGRRILLNCPGVISGRGCVTRETAGTLWKSNAYISHFERRRASFCFHPFFYYRTRALSPFLVLFTFRVSRAVPGYRTASAQECRAAGGVGVHNTSTDTLFYSCVPLRAAPRNSTKNIIQSITEQKWTEEMRQNASSTSGEITRSRIARKPAHTRQDMASF